MVNMSAKFDQEWHTAKLLSCSQAYFHISYLSIVTLTFDLQNQKGSFSYHG